MKIRGILKVGILSALKKGQVPLTAHEVKRQLPWINVSYGSVWIALKELVAARVVARVLTPCAPQKARAFLKPAGFNVKYVLTMKGLKMVELLDYVDSWLGVDSMGLLTSFDLSLTLEALSQHMVFMKGMRVYPAVLLNS